ncbi:hypothetical protein J5N58_25325 [Rhizobium cremeum]|uniref:hypothetical protein n=1 Tax=Rhizobium cremeum TaxID=2813827 RepID=UPI001FD245BF|nr:hypothetical protein [Rhizobium cremeum]MCJ7997913.1 hypothetical protein [Rhizobium cremeum]MCJ8003007.1 hypothetical protein [Rhizobium cremeum]
MSEFRLSFPANVIAGKNRLSAEDILLLRKYSFPLGIRTTDDVVTLLALNNSCPDKCEEWNSFFIESLTAFIVEHCYPQGSLDDINVEWMKCVLSTGGTIETSLELAVLLHVIDVVPHVPPSLRVFALDQLRIALAENAGALSTERFPSDGITAYDLVYLDRVLRSAFDGGVLRLTERERDALLAIEAAASKASSHVRWRDLLASTGRDIASSPRPKTEDLSNRWLKVPDHVFLDAEQVA